MGRVDVVALPLRVESPMSTFFKAKLKDFIEIPISQLNSVNEHYDRWVSSLTERIYYVEKL